MNNRTELTIRRNPLDDLSSGLGDFIEEKSVSTSLEMPKRVKSFFRLVDASSTQYNSLSITEQTIAEIVSAAIESALCPIQRRLDLIESQLSEISELISQDRDEETIILRDVSFKQAKEEIEELFKNTTDNLYFSDIMEQLGIDLELVVSVCNELLDEGKIEYGDEGAHTIPSRRDD